MRDETGWKLATTRAGASVMALLAGGATRCQRRCVARLAEVGAVRHCPRLGSAALEVALRSSAGRDAAACSSHARQLPHLLCGRTPSASSMQLAQPAAALARRLARRARRGARPRGLARPPARRRRGAAGTLGVGHRAAPRCGATRAASADLEPMSLADFTRWVDDSSSARLSFRPSPGDADSASGPCGRRDHAARTRDASSVRCGRPPRRRRPPPRRISTRAIRCSRAAGAGVGSGGLPIRRREAELLAFAQLLRLPEVTLFRRRVDGADPLGEQHVCRAGFDLALANAGRLRVGTTRASSSRSRLTPIRAGAPSVAADRLPRHLSASTFEALRDCPYRFFAQSVLGLREVDELEHEVEKRDYGKWLHDVLHAFHVGREPGRGHRSRHCAAARDRRREPRVQGLDEAAFLPFSASFEVLVPRYLAWLHRRDATGACWSEGEVELRATPEALGGHRADGRIDRIDVVDSGRRLELIDYKTGSSSRSKENVRERFEDTQLAFYAALVGARSPLPLRAFYLAMDATRALEVHEHLDVAATAAALIDGIAADVRRLRDGAALPPLGEGSAASTAMRGACAGATTGRTDPECLLPVRDAKDDRPCLSRRRRAGLARGVLCRRLRSGAKLRSRGVRRLGQDLDPGLAHAARAARRRRAARDPRHHLHPRRGGRNAAAAARMARRYSAPRSSTRAGRGARAAWRRAGTRGDARATNWRR